MSRIGRAPITVPAGVDVTIDGHERGGQRPQGPVGPGRPPRHADHARRRRHDRHPAQRLEPQPVLHGLTRTLLANMVTGVTTGFEKKLEIVGVGYRASKKGTDLEIQVGYSHPVRGRAPGEHRVRGARPHSDRGQGHRQAAGRPGGRRHPRHPQARALQGQRHPVRGRSRAAQGRQAGFGE